MRGVSISEDMYNIYHFFTQNTLRSDEVLHEYFVPAVSYISRKKVNTKKHSSGASGESRPRSGPADTCIWVHEVEASCLQRSDPNINKVLPLPHGDQKVGSLPSTPGEAQQYHVPGRRCNSSRSCEQANHKTRQHAQGKWHRSYIFPAEEHIKNHILRSISSARWHTHLPPLFSLIFPIEFFSGTVGSAWDQALVYPNTPRTTCMYPANTENASSAASRNPSSAWAFLTKSAASITEQTVLLMASTPRRIPRGEETSPELSKLKQKTTEKRSCRDERVCAGAGCRGRRDLGWGGVK